MATPNYGWVTPTVGGSEDTWGTELNALWSGLDTLLGGTDATEFAILNGATVSTAELNYSVGVTSAIQTQMDGKADDTATTAALALKADIASPTLTGTPAAPTAAADTNTTQIATTAFVEAAKAPTQLTAVWEAGTDTTESLVSAEKVKAAIDALVQKALGVGQTWQDVTGSRAAGTSYQNTTGQTISIAIECSVTASGERLQVSTDNATWINIGRGSNAGNYYGIIPNNHYYRVETGGDISSWAELR